MCGNDGHLGAVRRRGLGGHITSLSMTASRGSVRRSVTRMCVRVLCTTRSIGIGRGALRMSRTRQSHNGRLLSTKDVTQDSCTRLRTRIDASHCRLIATRTALRSCGLRLGRLLRLSNRRRVRICLPTLNSRGMLSPLPAGASIFHSTMTLHPRVRTDGLDMRTSRLKVEVTGSKCLPDIDLATNVNAGRADKDSFAFNRRIGGK